MAKLPQVKMIAPDGSETQVVEGLVQSFQDKGYLLKAESAVTDKLQEKVAKLEAALDEKIVKNKEAKKVEKVDPKKETEVLEVKKKSKGKGK